MCSWHQNIISATLGSDTIFILGSAIYVCVFHEQKILTVESVSFLVMCWWIGWLRLSVDIGAWIPWWRRGHKVRKHPAPGHHKAKHCGSSADGVPASGSCSLGFAQSELGGLIQFEDYSKPRIRDHWNFFLIIVPSHFVRWKSLQLCWINSFEAVLNASFAASEIRKKIVRWSWICLIQNLKYRIRNGTYLQCCLVSGFEISIPQLQTAACTCQSEIILHKNNCFARMIRGSMRRQYWFTILTPAVATHSLKILKLSNKTVYELVGTPMNLRIADWTTATW